eukprot:gene38522-22057_t
METHASLRVNRLGGLGTSFPLPQAPAREEASHPFSAACRPQESPAPSLQKKKMDELLEESLRHEDMSPNVDRSVSDNELKRDLKGADSAKELRSPTARAPQRMIIDATRRRTECSEVRELTGTESDTSSNSSPTSK